MIIPIIIKKLGRELYTLLDLQIKFKKLNSVWAYFYKNSIVFSINIFTQLNQNQIIDLVTHECTHILRQNHYHDKDFWLLYKKLGGKQKKFYVKKYNYNYFYDCKKCNFIKGYFVKKRKNKCKKCGKYIKLKKYI